MKYVLFSILMVCVMMSASTSFGQTPEPAKFASEKPLFARIGVAADDSKVMLVAFDESGGTGTGYDTVYADANFNDVLEAAEKVAVESGAGSSYVTFQAISLPFAYNANGAGLDNPLTLTLTRSSWMAGGPEFSATLRVRLREDDKNWEYVLRKTIQTSPERDKAEVQAARPLTANVRLQRGAGLGIAVTLSAGEFSLSCRTPEGNPQIRVLVLDAEHQTVSDATVPLDRLGYG